MNEFFQRLKQRKPVQWAAAYVAAAFALLQGIDIVAQQFGWPDGVRRGITLALVVGFFVTLVLAWYHGERGAQRVSGTELLILALLLALGGGFPWPFAATSPEAPGKAGAIPALAIPAKSIAVLPFVNMSSEKENDYFVDGLTEEILNRLAQIRALRVAHVLEGSVRKAGDRLRISAQLVRRADGFQLWLQTFERISISLRHSRGDFPRDRTFTFGATRRDGINQLAATDERHAGLQ